MALPEGQSLQDDVFLSESIHSVLPRTPYGAHPVLCGLDFPDHAERGLINLCPAITNPPMIPIFLL